MNNLKICQNQFDANNRRINELEDIIKNSINKIKTISAAQGIIIKELKRLKEQG